MRPPLPQPPHPDDAWLATQTVLYVEDDDTTRHQFGRFLRRRVGRLVEASGGAEGLERFRAEKPVLVITDIEMPGMDGLAMAQQIRTLDADVPIFVTTAYEHISYLRRSIDAGVDKFVAKPVNIDQFEEVLRACAGRLRAEWQLARQQEAADRRTRELEIIGQFAGGMAHDFNNILQVVLGNIELANHLAEPGTELADLVGSAQEAATQARDLSQHLFTLSGRRPTDLRVGPVGPTLAEALAGSRLSWRLGLPAGLPPVRHDTQLLGLVFWHLAQNAQEAMGEGGLLSVTGSVRQLRASEVPPLGAGDHVQLVFRDAGPGVSPEIIERIFDPYFSTKPRGASRGTGLGLALCRAILHRHHGAITAASPADGGAEFTVWLPASPRGTLR
jgi:signal transduction histidine kinase